MCISSFLDNLILYRNCFVQKVYFLNMPKRGLQKKDYQKASRRCIVQISKKTSCYRLLILNIFKIFLSCLWTVLYKKKINISKYHRYKVNQLMTSLRFVATIYYEIFLQTNWTRYIRHSVLSLNCVAYTKDFQYF